MSQKKFPFYRSIWILTALALMAFLFVFSGAFFRMLGDMVVIDDRAPSSDAVVVLNTDIELYPRLIQAAELYNQGLAENIVINGNRKTDTLRDLEAKGFKPCCPWYSDSVSILNMFSVPADKIIPISIEDAYDTVSEADAVGHELIKRKWKTVIITTSKYHTRRAKFIWQKMFGKQLSIYMVSAKTDPYDPHSWWKDGRQIRWLLAEYGAWIYYWWKEITGI
jgi:uncharacterized SAM-binding protein YcdF (DUF218 family)